MRKSILFIATVLSWQVTIAQHTVVLSTGEWTEGIKIEMPQRQIENVDDGTIVTYLFNSIAMYPNSVMPNTYYLKVGGFGVNQTEEQPAVPMRWDSFTIPEGALFEISVLDSSFVDIPIPITPASAPDIISIKEQSPKVLKAVKPFKGMFPQKIALYSSSKKYRNNSIISVCVCPVQYDYINKIARIYTKLKYKISYTDNCQKAELKTKAISLSDRIDPFLNNTTLNYCPPISKARSTQQIRKDYLILSIPQYANAVNRFADWKRTLGFNVHVEIKSVSEWNSSTIQSVVNYYVSNYQYLEHLLIIGDMQDIPAMEIGSSGIYSDYYYLNTSGSISPVSHGRLSVDSEYGAEIVVNKIIDYERNPTTDASFYSRALCCSYFQDRPNLDDSIGSQYEYCRFVKTSEEIRNYLMSKQKSVGRIYDAPVDSYPKFWNNGVFSWGEEIPTELQKPTFAWNGNYSDINDSINAGCFCVFHNDHGGTTVWRNPWYSHYEIDVLNNQNKLPVVFSMGCDTGKFNGNTCFAEHFLRKENGGCVAIYAFTDVAYVGYVDALVEGMVDAIWPNPGLIPLFPHNPPANTTTPTPTYCLGQIMKQGLQRMDETWYDNTNTVSTIIKERFHCFGDPSMKIYTEQPTAFGSANITRTSTNITAYTGGETATISFFNNQTNAVTAYEGTYAQYNGDADNVTVCISAHNKIPYISDVLYIQNETLSGTNNFEADIINVGTDVTNKKAEGDVIIQSGHTTLNGNTVKLKRGVTVQLGAQFEINN